MASVGAALERSRHEARHGRMEGERHTGKGFAVEHSSGETRPLSHEIRGKRLGMGVGGLRHRREVEVGGPSRGDVDVPVSFFDEGTPFRALERRNEAGIDAVDCMFDFLDCGGKVSCDVEVKVWECDGRRRDGRAKVDWADVFWRCSGRGYCCDDSFGYGCCLVRRFSCKDGHCTAPVDAKRDRVLQAPVRDLEGDALAKHLCALTEGLRRGESREVYERADVDVPACGGGY